MLFDHVKQILFNKTTSTQSCYKKLGELVQKELKLNNLQITTQNQKQKEWVIQYLSNGHYLLKTKKNRQQYVNFVTQLIEDSQQKSLYSEKEINTHFGKDFETVPQQYLGILIKFKNVTVGCIGVFSDLESNDISTHFNTLQIIADYIGIFYGAQYLEEESLRQTSRLSAIFESSSDLIWSVDRSMEVVSFNQNYFRAIFYKYQGGIVTEHFKDGSNETFPFDEFWEAKYQKVFKDNSLRFEVELKHPDNSPAWKEVFLIPIFKADGSIDEVSGIARDINDRKKTIKALEQEEKKFKQIFDSFQDLYVRVDLAGKINMISPSVTDMIGYTSEEIMDQDVTNYYLYDVRTKNLFPQLIKVGSLRNIEINLISKQGKIIPCICNIRAIKDSNNDKIIALEGICRDITEIKQINEALISTKESLEISLKAKEQFLANMSHEIRTPMNGIIGLLEMMMDTPLNDEQTKYLSTIKQSSKLLLNVLNDILDLSKINVGKLQINKKEFSIHHLLENVKTLFSSEVEQKKLNFHVIIEKSVPKYAKSDKLRLLQVLSNLISNAIKFTPDNGRITIKIAFSKPSTFKVNVIDNGIGIDADNVSKLFKNFTQINDSYSKQFAGAGLGLAISKNLVELLDGEIGVESTYGKGSDFWFTFKATPATHKNKDGINQVNKSANISRPVVQDKRILIVDDNVTNRLVACEILRKSGLNPDEADSGQKAIDMSLENSYDVIFMDIQMPKMDGRQAMLIIKEEHPNQVIIAMTAYDNLNQSEKFIEMGFDEYLAKPITPTSLINMLNGVKVKDSQTHPTISSSYNFEVIKNLAKYIDFSTIANTFQEFEEGLTDKIKACKTAYENQSYSVISGHAHSIKGDASTIGLGEIASQADKIEKNIDKEYFSSLHEDLKTLYLKLKKVPVIIKDILNRLSHEYKNINR